METAVLELQGVNKSYGDFQAVKDLSLVVPQGSICGFLGPNGAGKTTTLRMVLDIIKPSSGTIRVLGQPAIFDVRDRIGYLPEEKGLYKKMKACDVITYFSMLKGVPLAEARRNAMRLLERYGLGEFARSKIESLSKGMSQKVQVIASTAHDPDLVILDEPFSGLDPINQKVLEELVMDLATRGKTILFSTHVMQHAERMCDHIFLIARGRKIFDGSVQAAKQQLPRRLYITMEGDAGAIGRIPGVVAVKPDERQQEEQGGQAGPVSWQVDYDMGVDPNRILKACFENNIPLLHFDQQEPSLHDVFVELVERQSRAA